MISKRSFCTIIIFFIIFLSGCAAWIHGWTTSDYSGIILSTNTSSGSKRLTIERNLDHNIDIYVEQNGIPEYIYVVDVDNLYLFYTENDYVIKCSRPNFDVRSNMTKFYPIPKKYLDVFPESAKKNIISKRITNSDAQNEIHYSKNEEKLSNNETTNIENKKATESAASMKIDQKQNGISQSSNKTPSINEQIDATKSPQFDADREFILSLRESTEYSSESMAKLEKIYLNDSQAPNNILSAVALEIFELELRKNIEKYGIGNQLVIDGIPSVLSNFQKMPSRMTIERSSQDEHNYYTISFPGASDQFAEAFLFPLPDGSVIRFSGHVPFPLKRLVAPLGGGGTLVWANPEKVKAYNLNNKTIIMANPVENHFKFYGDPDNPLTFNVMSPHGYVYLHGKGYVIYPDGSQVNVGNMTVSKAQETLKELGYHPGSIDGIFGEKTRDAIMQYQRDLNLPITGQLDEATTQALGVKTFKPKTKDSDSRINSSWGILAPSGCYWECTLLSGCDAGDGAMASKGTKMTQDPHQANRNIGWVKKCQ